MDFRQLEAFVHIVNKGSFTKAAEEMYLSQPTVSAHIDSLEKELGILLLERNTRSVLLTEAGKTFYPYALDILNLKQKALNHISQFTQGVKGTLIIAASTIPGIYILPDIFRAYSALYPSTSFNLTLSNSEEVIRKVLEYKVDFGFVGSLQKNRALNFVPIIEDELVIAVPQKDDFASLPDMVSFSQIEHLPFILREKGSGTRKTFEQALEKLGKTIDDINVHIITESLESVKQLIARGLGISPVSSISICPGDHVRILKLQNMDLKRKFYLVYHKNKVFSPIGEKFMQFLTEGGYEHETNILG